MPPAVTRAFGFEGTMNGKPVPMDKYGDFRYKGGDQQLEDGKAGKKYSGLGRECGVVPDPVSGGDVDAGKLLMRDQWNSDLFEPLGKLYEEGKKLEGRSDIWVHKNRMSGLWGSGTALEEVLEKEGIRTLLCTGVGLGSAPVCDGVLTAALTGEHRSVRRRHLSRRVLERLRLHSPQRRLRYHVPEPLPANDRTQCGKHMGLCRLVQRSCRCRRAHETMMEWLLGRRAMHAKLRDEVRF